MLSNTTKLIFFLVFLFLSLGCSKAPSEIHLSGPTMGTTYNVKFWSPAEIDQASLQTKIDLELARINKLMSTYDPTSELSEFNQSTSVDVYPLSPDTLKVIKEGMRIGRLSDGYLDITVGPLVNLWGFGPQAKPEVVPSKQDIAIARRKTGLEKLVLHDDGAQKSHTGLYVDLSTIAKGFGVDQVAELMEQAGIENYLVEVGGEMRQAGIKANGNNWNIAIEKPVTTERAVQKLIQVGNNAIATSGDYRNYYEENGRRYSHLIDPKTGYPIEHNLVSVTVVHPSCMMADGFATAISVMGKAAGLKLAQQNNLAVMLITRENGEFKEYTTAAFEKFL